MRWSMRVAYYVIMGMAAKLIDAVDNTATNKVFKSPQVLMRFVYMCCDDFHAAIKEERAMVARTRQT